MIACYYESLDIFNLGHILGVEVLQGSKFTKTDISNGGVVYSSEGGDSEVDTIVIDVSDGVHHIPAHLGVSILSVDSGFPTYGMYSK